MGKISQSQTLSKSNPICKKWDFCDSLNWKLMIHNSNNIEHHIQWNLNSGDCSLWLDNSLCEGLLVVFSNQTHRFHNQKIANFSVDGQWNYQLLIQQPPPNQLANIKATKIRQQHLPFQVYWKANSNGMFCCS